MFEGRVGHQRSRAARRSAADFFSFEIARCPNVASDNERLERPINGASKNLGRRAAHDALNDAVDRRAIIEVTAHERRIDSLGRHENHLEIDPLLPIKSFVKGSVKRQKAYIVDWMPILTFLAGACASVFPSAIAMHTMKNNMKRSIIGPASQATPVLQQASRLSKL